MQIQLVAVGNKMPGWVSEGYSEYAKRLPRECELVLKEVNPGKRGKNANLDQIREDEGARILSLIGPQDWVVALEVEGKPLSTSDLSKEIERWMADGLKPVLVVGGPEGLSESIRKRANLQWSLSPLTLPHPLVRVLISEQIYRAWSLLKGHPYHR